MITKKQNETILFFAEKGKYTYLAGLFKLIYFFELETYLKTKKRFFKKTEFIADSIAPIPVDIWEYMKTGKLFEKYPNTYELIIPLGKKFNYRNIKDIKIIGLRDADLSVFSNDELERLGKIKNTYKGYVPSAMFEKQIFRKKIYRDMIEDGDDGKNINLDKIF